MFFLKNTRYYRIYEVRDFFDTYIACEWGSLKNKKPTGKAMHFFVSDGDRDVLLAQLYAKRLSRGYSVANDSNQQNKE